MSVLGRSLSVLGLALAALLVAIPAEAMTGTEWQRLPPAARSAYVDGVIDVISHIHSRKPDPKPTSSRMFGLR